MKSRISGTGRYLPERVVKIADSVAADRTDVAQYHVVGDGETTADLAEAAARKALTSAGVDAKNVDLLIVGTTTPDIVFPNLGCMLQERLGISACPAFSLEASVSGFVYALSIGDRFVASGQSSVALIIGAETLSRISMPDSGAGITGTPFGDGAGAVLLEPTTEAGLLACQLGADTCVCTKPAEQLLQTISPETIDANLADLSESVRSMLTDDGLGVDDINWLIPHQSTPEIIARTADNLGISPDKIVMTLVEHGNTGSASVPIALDVAIADGRIRRDDLLLLETVGGDFTWGSVLVRY